MQPTRWAPRYEWSYNTYTWPYIWVTGVITLLINGKGPSCLELRQITPIAIPILDDQNSLLTNTVFGEVPYYFYGPLGPLG